MVVAWSGPRLTEKPDCTEAEYISHLYFGVIPPPSKFVLIYLGFRRTGANLLVSRPCIFFVWRLSSHGPWQESKLVMAVMKFQHFVSWPVSLFLCQYLTAVLETETLQDSSLSISLLSQGRACEPCRLLTSQEGQPLSLMAPASWSKLLGPFDCERSQDGGSITVNFFWELPWGREAICHVLEAREVADLRWALPLLCPPCSCCNLRP